LISQWFQHAVDIIAKQTSNTCGTWFHFHVSQAKESRVFRYSRSDIG
jgi:hypothetical protein